MRRPGHKKMYFKNIYLLVAFLFFINSKSIFAQLTYTHLAVQYDTPWTCGKLQLFPIRFKDIGGGENDFAKGSIISFEQALREGKISVKETKAGGGDDVGLLGVRDHSKKSILVNSGEIVAGGRQDRVFGGTSIITPGERKTVLPVFCIEKGRWDKKRKAFRYAGSANSQLRKEINVSKKQNKIWKEIDRQLIADGAQNITSTYLNLYKSDSKIDSACLVFFNNKIRESDSAYAGFVAVTGNRIINCELFGSSSLCIASFEVMLKSYMRSITANDGPPTVSNERVKKFLAKFLETEAQQKQYLLKHGSLYTSNGRAIHLVAYDE